MQTTPSSSSSLTSAERYIVFFPKSHFFAHCIQDVTINTSVQEIKDGSDNLPPLRNPPLLETADDLATLSHLNEPSGARFVCQGQFFLSLNETFDSTSHHPQPLCPAQYLHIQRYCPYCRQPFPTRDSIWSGNHPSVCWSAAGRIGTPSLRHC